MREVFLFKRWLAAALIVSQIVWVSPAHASQTTPPTSSYSSINSATLRGGIEGQTEPALRRALAPPSLAGLEESSWLGGLLFNRRHALAVLAGVLFLPPVLHPVDGGQGEALVVLNGNQRPPAPELTLNVLDSSEPSAELLAGFKEKLAATKSDTLAGKLTRSEIGVRIIQVDLLLGDKGSGKYAKIGIQPKQASDAAAALKKADLKELNDLTKAENRKTLWDAIGAAHPSYRFYVEGVRVAGHLDDQQLLQKNLELFKEAWIATSGGRLKAETTAPVEEWMRGILLDALKFQSIGTVQEAIALIADVKTVAPSTAYGPRGRKVGDPPFMSSRPMPVLLALNQVTAFDKAVHQASALQRSGVDVTLWSIAAERNIDASTKTVAQEPVAVFFEGKEKTKIIAIGADDVLSTVKGAEKVAAGAYRFPSADSLKDLLARRGQYQVPMGKVLEASNDPFALSLALQASLKKKGMRTLDNHLRHTTFTDFWYAFSVESEQSLGIAPQQAFIAAVKENGIRVFISKVEEGKPGLANPVDIDKRGKDEILLKHEAVLGRTFHMLPPKSIPGIRFITLQSEPIKETIKFGIKDERGRVEIKDVERPVMGRGWNDRLLLAGPYYTTALHELMHRWAYARTEVFKDGMWEGTLIDLFNDIGWEKKEKTWVLRKGPARIEDFLWEYGAVNQDEDFAVMGQYYAILPKEFRDHLRAQIAKGNFVPAVKYLHMKHIAFLDLDGRTLEFETDSADPPFTYAEFDKAIAAADKTQRGGLTDEQKRLRGQAEQIKRVSDQMIKNKTIVYFIPGFDRPMLLEPALGARNTLRLLGETAEGPGILVVEAGVISRRVGLEEFVAQVPAELARRIVLFGSDSAAAKEAAARNGVRIVDSDSLVELAVVLAGLEQADRVGFLGDPANAAILTRMLPSSMGVTALDWRTALLDLFAFLGIPPGIPVDAVGLEEELARQRSA